MNLEHDYLAKLWQYNEEQPELGMRKKEDLEKIFYAKDFSFTKGSYQAGELSYMARFSERLLHGFLRARLEEDKVRQEEGREELTEEEKEKEKQREELYTVTQNRRKLILKDLSTWFERREEIFYYQSKATDQPYIDAKGRIYVFTDVDAIEKAATEMKDDPDVALVSAPLASFLNALYRNGAKQIVMNNTTLAFTALREELFPQSEEEKKEEDKRISDHNRNLRFALLIFLQLLKSPQFDDKEEQKKLALQQAEAQISTILLQTKLFFKSIEQENNKRSFVLMTNENGIHAIAAYTDLSLVEDAEYDDHIELAFYPVAKQVVESTDTQMSGIIINAGELNFLLDRNWLMRLTKFAEYLQNKQDGEQN